MTVRPTPEQQAILNTRWEAEKGSVASFLPPQIAKDLVVVGGFLDMVLKEKGASEAFCHRCCEAFGKACFGREAWAAFDLLFPKALEALEADARKELWADTPFEQNVPEPSPALQEFFNYAKGFRGAEGVFPQPGLVDRGDKRALESMAVDGMTVYKRMIESAGDPEVTELVYAVDMSSKPGQGLEFDDFLGVVWMYEGRFYSGVINYETGEDEDLAFRPIDWNNNYWNHSLHEYPIAKMQEARDALDT